MPSSENSEDSSADRSITKSWWYVEKGSTQRKPQLGEAARQINLNFNIIFMFLPVWKKNVEKDEQFDRNYRLLK